MSLQFAVFLAYFAVVFGIGWLSLRLTQDDRDYWIAGGNLGWLAGGASLSATHISAGTFIGTIGVIYTAGWSFGWLVLSLPLSYWFMAAVLAPRFTKVKELTLPAFIQTRYESKAARGIAAGIILIATIVYIQAQIVAGGIVANTIFGIPTSSGMLIFTGILLLYTVFGGMIAVVYTDLLQAIIMFAGALLAVPLALRQLGGLDAMFVYAETMNVNAFTWEGMPLTLLFTMGLAFFLGSCATPEKLTRLYAMKDMRTIRRGVMLTIFLVTAINLLVFVLGMTSIVFFPTLRTGDLAMPALAGAVLPSVMGALLLAAITSAMMSTVDSLLLVAGSALSEDIYRTLFKPHSPPKERLFIARIGIFLVGCLPLLLIFTGVGEGELIQFIVILFVALMAASFFAPVVGGVIWKRATRQGAIAAMIGGVTTALIWEGWGPTHIDSVLPGFAMSCLLMIGVSMLTEPPSEATINKFFDD